jgi:hypothetical protein
MEVDHHATVTRKTINLRETANVPHQEPGIELIAPESAADPARTPVVNYQETVLPIKDSLPKQRDIPVEMDGSGLLLPE